MFTKKILIAAVCGLAFAASPALADTMQLTGTIRDFKRGDQTGGHPDFETCHTVAGHGDYGLVTGMVAMDLSSDGKPVYNTSRPSNDSMSGATNFGQWFRDTPSINLSQPQTITLSNGQSAAGGVYSYSTTAFYPIDGKLLGNQNQKDASGAVHNFSFTFELNTKFTYRPGQNFQFTGDDDVWVFVDGKKVVDLGGVHSAVNGSVRLFNGKAFVNNSNFTTGGVVQALSASQSSSLNSQWIALGLGASGPFATGDKFIDMNLNAGQADVTTTFTATSATVKSTANLAAVCLRFSDGTAQWFENLSVGGSATFSGTGAYAGKTVNGCWVRAGTGESVNLQFFGSDGSGGQEHTLAFFFAERHVTESNFRIDTSMQLKAASLSTVSPLYD